MSFGDGNRQLARKRAIKQQRSIPVVHIRYKGVRVWHCALCGNAVEEKNTHCWYCGVRLLWQEAKEKEKEYGGN